MLLLLIVKLFQHVSLFSFSMTAAHFPCLNIPYVQFSLCSLVRGELKIVSHGMLWWMDGWIASVGLGPVGGGHLSNKKWMHIFIIANAFFAEIFPCLFFSLAGIYFHVNPWRCCENSRDHYQLCVWTHGTARHGVGYGVTVICIIFVCIMVWLLCPNKLVFMSSIE